MPLKITNVSEKKKAKLFTQGTPKDFTLTTANRAVVTGTLASGGKGYNISISSRELQDSSGLREIAEHFSELADILEGKIAA